MHELPERIGGVFAVPRALPKKECSGQYTSNSVQGILLAATPVPGENTMPLPPRRPILERIMEGSIETNYLIFPPAIGEFTRDLMLIYDNAPVAYFKFVIYTRGDEMGAVFLDDLWKGLRQVRAFEREPLFSDTDVPKMTPSMQILYAE
jgi:hypothetical protein